MAPDTSSGGGPDGAAEGDSATAATDPRRDPGPATSADNEPESVSGVSDPEWVPLSVAAQQLGVSISALRKAFRNGRIVSRIVQGRHGPQRLVRLAEVSDVVGVRRWREYDTLATPSAAERGAAAGHAIEEEDRAHITKAEWDALVEELATLRAAVQQVLEEDSLVGEVLLEHLREHDKAADVKYVDPPPNGYVDPEPATTDGRTAKRGRHRRFGLPLRD
jgi:hypothetical protein